MIDKTAIHETGKKLGFSQWQAEKDYLQHLFLHELYSITNRELVFKGGTCLQKAYGLYRFSRDLDFNLVGKFNAPAAVLRITKKFTEVGFLNKVSKTEDTIHSVNFLISFESALMKNSLTVQISRREHLELSARQIAITPTYADIPPYFCICMDEQEIAAEKIRTIYQRAFPRDVYDLWFLLNKGVTPNPGLVIKKLSKIKEKYDKNKFISKLRPISENWNELRDLLVAYPPFETVVEEIVRRI